MQNFRNLDIWKHAHEIALDVYHISAKFPKEEQFGITSQLRRASTSIGANIAEGAGRRTDNDFRQFLYNAMGSLKECDNFLTLAKDLNYLPKSDYDMLAERIDHLGKMLTNFIKSINES